MDDCYNNKRTEQSSDNAEFMRDSAQSNICLFDQKAGALLAFSIAMALFVFEALICPEKMGKCFGDATLLADLSACVTEFFLLIACFAALQTLRPKSKTKWNDQIYWGAEIFGRSLDEFLTRATAVPSHDAAEARLRHVYVLAQICRTKSARLRWAMWLTVTSFFLVVGTKILRLSQAPAPSWLHSGFIWMHQHLHLSCSIF